MSYSKGAIKFVVHTFDDIINPLRDSVVLESLPHRRLVCGIESLLDFDEIHSQGLLKLFALLYDVPYYGDLVITLSSCPET